MTSNTSDIIIEDEEEEKRNNLFQRIDNFVDNKFTKDFVPFRDYLKNSSNKAKKLDPTTKATTDNKDTNVSSASHTLLQLSREDVKFAKPKKTHKIVYKGKEPVFKSYESIMKKVKNKYHDGYYTDIITHNKYVNKKILISKKLDALIDDDDSSSESEDEEAKHLDYLESIIYKKKNESQIGPLYWHLVKLLRYIRISDVHGSLLCLCYMNNDKLKTPECMRAMEDCDGMSLMLNLLTTNDIRCRIGALKLIRELLNIIFYCRNLTFLGGIQPLVENLKHHNGDLQCLAAESLAKVAVFRRARSNIRRFDGISHLVYLLSIDLPKNRRAMESENKYLRATIIQRNAIQVSVTQNAATALWKVSKSKRNRIRMRRAGVIPLLGKLLHSDIQNILIPAIGILQQCASELYYRVSIRTENMFPILLTHMVSSNIFLKTQSTLTIFKCAVDSQSRDMFRNLGGVGLLISNLSKMEDHDLIYALTGATWKLCVCPIISAEFTRKGGTDILLNILETLPKTFELYYRPQISASDMLNKLEKAEKIMVNVTGALCETSKLEEGRELFAIKDATKNLVSLLKMSDNELLFNIMGVLKEIAKHPTCLTVIRNLDGIQKLFAMTLNPQPIVVAAALEALKSCFSYSSVLNELIIMLSGSMEIAVKQLESVDQGILTAACSLIAEMGRAPENVAVLTDLGVVRLLSRLVKTDDDNLRCSLSEAIAMCSDYKDNREQFGRANVVTPLVNFLRSSDVKVHAAAAKALYKLSQDINNSREMNQAGVSQLMINMIGSGNPDLQYAVAGALGNLRRQGIETEKQVVVKKLRKMRKSRVKSWMK